MSLRGFKKNIEAYNVVFFLVAPNVGVLTNILRPYICLSRGFKKQRHTTQFFQKISSGAQRKGLLRIFKRILEGPIGLTQEIFKRICGYYLFIDINQQSSPMLNLECTKIGIEIILVDFPIYFFAQSTNEMAMWQVKWQSR